MARAHMAEERQGGTLKASKIALNIASLQCIVIAPNERFLFGNAVASTVDMYKCDLHEPSKTCCLARLYIDRNTRRFVR